MTPIFNLSFCIYIGNTTPVDDQTLLNYCSRFGTVRSSPFGREQFCDFHLIEFANHEQSQRFLNQNNHEINRIVLDVKFYKHILTHHDILNIDRKFYIGPIYNSNDEHTIVQFYKAIDPVLQYCRSKEDNEVYLLFEFNNRQSIARIFEKQTMPITNEHRKFSLHKPIHPKEFVNKIISMKNNQNQICVRGLTDDITEAMLINYFHKRAPVIACRILSDHSKSAILEFDDQKTVRKILETPNVRLQGINLSLRQSSRHLDSLLSSTDNHSETDEDMDEIKTSPLEYNSRSFQVQNQPSSVEFLLNHRENIRQELLPFVRPSPSFVTESILIPSPVNNESGWSSPPRTVITDSPPLDRSVLFMSSNSGVTTDSTHLDPSSRLTTIDVDVKPIQKSSSNNNLRFLEQVQIELDQIKDEYRYKFEQDRACIDKEIDSLINEERQTFDRLSRRLIDHRRRVEKRDVNNKRKFSPTSSAQ